MDISSTTAPDSTQVNADDLIGGPITVTITDVTAGTSEQPVNISLAEIPDRVYRPGKSMRRVLVAAWGAEASAYVGRRMTLYRDPDIRFGKDAVGGVRISHMSDIPKRLSIALTVTRGQRKPFTVEPLTAELEIAALRAEWSSADADRQAAIKARVAELQTSPAAVAPAAGVPDEAAPDATNRGLPVSSEPAGEVDPSEVNFDDEAGA